MFYCKVVIVNKDPFARETHCPGTGFLYHNWSPSQWRHNDWHEENSYEIYLAWKVVWPTWISWGFDSLQSVLQSPGHLRMAVMVAECLVRIRSNTCDRPHPHEFGYLIWFWPKLPVLWIGVNFSYSFHWMKITIMDPTRVPLEPVWKLPLALTRLLIEVSFNWGKDVFHLRNRDTPFS